MLYNIRNILIKFTRRWKFVYELGQEPLLAEFAHPSGFPLKTALVIVIAV